MADEARGNKCILNSDNYEEWASRTRLYLKKKKLWQAVEGWPTEYKKNAFGVFIYDDEGNKVPVEISRKEEARRNDMNNSAHCTIAELVNKEALHEIEYLETAKEAWDRLDLLNVELKCDDAGDYITKIIELSRKCKHHLEMDFSDRILGAIALANLPSKFSLMVRTVDKTKIALPYVKAQIKQEITRQKQDGERETEENVRALMLKKEAAKKEKKPESEKPQAKKKIIPKKPVEEKKNEEDKPKRFICYTCGKPDHMARDCPNYEESKKSEEEKKEEKPKKEEKKKCAKLSLEKVKVFRLSKKKENSKKKFLLLDNWATDHMLRDKELFDNISPASGEVSQGDGSAIQIEGIGTARLRLSEKCGGYTIVLKKAFYIPNLSDNIVSQAELENKGVEFHSKKDTSTAFIDDEVLFTAFKMGKLTWLTLDGVGEEDNEEIRKTLAGTTIETWHYKMGHLHEKALKKLPVTMKSKPDSLEHCETCCTTKNKKESYPKNHPCKPKQPLERIHSDLMGKLNPASKGGAEYIATFIDGYSNHVTAIPMKKKSDTLGEFKKYQARVANLHDKKIKEIQTDNGTEYVNSEFKAHLEDGGVLHRKSVKKNPQQNGKAERQNQTLMSTVRSMLKQAGMPKEFWGEALNAACYVRNRSLSAAIGGKIPLELWLDRKLTKEDYENIKVFGCLAYAHVDDAGKFDDKGEKCVFLGYPDGVKGYRLWSMSRNQAIISRDVKFFEKIFPFKQKQKPKQTEQYENYFSTSDESESECEEEKSSADNESESDPEPSGSESDAHSGSDSDTKTSESEQQTTSDEEDGEESGEENGNTEVDSEENNTEDEENSEHKETINLHSEDEDQEENQSSSSEEEQPLSIKGEVLEFSLNMVYVNGCSGSTWS
ncbi:hypothetical protein FOCC_FOCC015594 [Frankliniella occidentalis]|nr:hypothetical protein FOCC_FOCC015594 [Frankliniella occidentalis]